MLVQVAKRLIRAPMSAADLLKVSGSLVENPPVPDDMRFTLTTRKYSDGRSFLEGWRSEMKTFVEDIAAEKTWWLQRQRLIHFRVAAATWIALYKAVGVEPRISLWRSYVEGIGEFATNPESSWPTLLPKVFWFATLHNAVLCPLGMACYATDKALERHLELLASLREHVISKGLVLDRGIQDLDEIDPHLAESLMHARNGMVHPQSLKLFGFLRELADRIETRSVQDDAVATKWTELCNDLNAQILALDVASHLQGLRVVDVVAVLDSWRAIHQAGDINIDVTRYVPGSVPPWAQWSGSTWVAGREQRLKYLEEQKLPISDECWLHLSLPPGWEPQHENEYRAAQQYGRWLSETEWQPPPGRQPNSWREIVD
jgi:hypothetical protein